METVLTQSSAEVQSFSAHKQITKPKKTTRSFVSKPRSENMQRGLLLAPPQLPSRSHSYSHPPSLALHSYNSIQQQAPPLLPLPVPKLRHNSLPSPSRKATRARDQSLTPKKSKQPNTRRSEESPTTTAKQGYTKPVEKTIAKKLALLSSSESLMVAATTNPLGPDPNDLPKDVSKVLCAGIVAVHNNKDFETFSGSVFTISPPPSSLPLPKFSMKPKQLISCNAEAAAGIDAGATDNLRRLLRLR